MDSFYCSPDLLFSRFLARRNRAFLSGDIGVTSRRRFGDTIVWTGDISSCPISLVGLAQTEAQQQLGADLIVGAQAPHRR
jgi:hypothetical protein